MPLADKSTIEISGYKITGYQSWYEIHDADGLVMASDPEEGIADPDTNVQRAITWLRNRGRIKESAITDPVVQTMPTASTAASADLIRLVDSMRATARYNDKNITMFGPGELIEEALEYTGGSMTRESMIQATAFLLLEIERIDLIEGRNNPVEHKGDHARENTP
jgi:hypothetical protein